MARKACDTYTTVRETRDSEAEYKCPIALLLFRTSKQQDLQSLPSRLSPKTPPHTMKFLTAAGLAAAAFSGHALVETMAELKQLKEASWASLNETGVFDLDQYDSSRAPTSCVNGKAGEYQCSNVDLISFLRHQDMGSSARKGNDVCK